MIRMDQKAFLVLIVVLVLLGAWAMIATPLFSSAQTDAPVNSDAEDAEPVVGVAVDGKADRATTVSDSSGEECLPDTGSDLVPFTQFGLWLLIFLLLLMPLLGMLIYYYEIIR